MQSSGRNNLEILTHDIETLGSMRPKEPVDYDFSQACRWLNREILGYKMPHLVVRDIQPIYCDTVDDVSILLFSGGRVSTATALQLRSMGKNVILLHVETDDGTTHRVKQISELLSMPLVLLKPTIRRSYLDYFYGMYLANTAVQYAIENGHAPRVYMGCFYMASTFNNDRKDWKYCLEFINAYESVVRKYIYGAEIIRLIPSPSVVEDEFIRHKEYLQFFA